MKASELRIGNLVQDYGLISTITGQDIYDLSQGMDSEIIQPIPLTEDLLLKFGFYKNVDTLFFEKGGYQLDLNSNNVEFYIPNYGDYYKEIEYVHQLQNLYFALTGEELSYNELIK
ncbi:MAG: hypothetical protein FGM14_15115 [Flavobacteriales bacterium]|nr:hypothetical protein [Flavobacteriales bacterium]